MHSICSLDYARKNRDGWNQQDVPVSLMLSTCFYLSSGRASGNYAALLHKTGEVTAVRVGYFRAEWATANCEHSSGRDQHHHLVMLP